MGALHLAVLAVDLVPWHQRPGIKKPNEFTRRELSESMRNFLAREKSEDQEEKSTDKQKFNLDSSRPPD